MNEFDQKSAPMTWFFQSRLKGSPGLLSGHTQTARGFIREMFPLVLFLPLNFQFSARINQLIDRSAGFLLLLFGLIPIDFHQLRFVEVIPNGGFQEQSTNLSAVIWRHRRHIAPDLEGGCSVTDRLEAWPRSGFHRVLLSVFVPLLFRWRHYRLRSFFG